MATRIAELPLAQPTTRTAGIAVVIPTRNRGAQAAEAVKAVLCDAGDFELVVVDQSTDDATESAIRGAVQDSRLRVIRSSCVGISRAKNIGVAATAAPIIAFTDDDCRAEPGWVSAVLRVFTDDREAALLCGRVHLPAHSNVEGFAASFEPVRRILQGGLPTPDRFGMGANFAIRRDVFERLGGFDPLLGTGAPFFRAAEDTDLLIRALHTGHRVVNASECDVLHLGVRTGADVHPLLVGYQIGIGAALGKHARLAGLAGLRDVWRWTTFNVKAAIRDSLRLRRLRVGVPCYLIAGMLLSLRYRIDHVHRVFRTRGRAERQPVPGAARVSLDP